MATIRIPARQYEDHDDCLTAAAADYATTHDLQGWDLEPRYEDDANRETILLTVPPGNVGIADGWNVYRYDDENDGSKQTLVGTYSSLDEAVASARRIGGQVQRGLDGEVINP